MVLKSFKGVACLALIVFLVTGCRGQSAEELLQEGTKLAAAGNYNGAIVFFKNALEKDANSIDARYQLAEAYLRSGRFEQAEREFEKVTRQNRSYPGLDLQLAELYLATDRPNEALALIDSHLAAQGSQPGALDLRGRALAAREEFGAAEQAFAEAIRIEPGHFSARINLAAVYLQGERHEAARTVLGRILEEDPDNTQARYMLAGMDMNAGKTEAALAHYGRIVEIDPADSRAVYLTGLLHLQLGDLEKGRQAALTLSERFPKHAFAPQLKGLSLYREGQYEDAVVELQKAIRIRPELTASYFLGMCYYHLGKLELALSQMQQVLDHQPTSVQTRVMVAAILLQQKRTDDAVREVMIALRHDAESGIAYNVLGSAYMVQGKYDEAMAAFNQATELDPQLADVHFKKGVFNLGQGNLAKGEEDMMRAVEIAPEVLNTRIVLATHQLRRQNYPAAIRTLEEGLRGQPEDAVLYNIMAGAFFAQKQSAKAVEALHAAKKADPSFFTPYFNLASYFLGRGEKDKAHAEYEAVLQKDPGQTRALISAGQLAEMEGKEREALSFYQKARVTGTIEGFLALISFHVKQGKEELAFAVLDEGLKIHADSPALVEIKGRLLLRAGRQGEAVETLHALEKLSPGRGYPVVVQVHMQRSERAKAEEIARQVMRNSPDKAYGYVLQANIHEMSGERQEALRVLEGARAAVKADPQLEMQIGMLHLRAEDRSRAAETFRRVMEKSPRFYPAIFALGTIQEEAGNKREALKLYEQVLQIENNFVPALNNLAYLHAENFGNPEEGLKLALQAFRKEPNKPEIMDTLGFLLLRNGRAGEALPLLEKASGLLPDSPTIQYHLGLTYKELGEREKAVAALKKSLELGDFPEQRQSRSLLAKLAE
jgi:putative PEP-CTERM system TPR-repeat lipoprotein